jgi:hypothetical protein
MQSNHRIKVLPIHPGMLGRAWHYVGPLLLRGQIECTPQEGTPADQMQASLTELLNYVLKAHRGECIIWCVIDEDKRKVVSAMISEITVHDGDRVIWVSRMAGDGILSWGKELYKTFNDHAKEQGVSVVRFWGRKALQRAYGGVRIIKSDNGRTHLFEGAVA